MRGRIRTIKPELFSDEELADLEQECGLPLFRAFVGLLCFADREGRFEWRPRALKTVILPYWEGDFATCMEALASRSFIVRYTVEGRDYGYVRTFKTHQVINNKEQPSSLPSPGDHARVTRSRRDGFVYLATYQGANSFKVGFSARSPASRVNDLACGSPEPLFLVEQIEGSFDLESEIHHALKPFNKHREWFHSNDESVRVLHAWFTRDPRVVDVGKGNGTEGNGNGTGTEGIERARAVILPEPDDLTEPVSYTRVPSSWSPSESLYAEALMVGVTRAALDEDVTYWRARKLGGEFHDIDGFFRSHFTRLAKRRETESFKQSKHKSAQPNLGRTGLESLEGVDES